MRTDSEWLAGPGVKVSVANRTDDGWIVFAVMSGDARCPVCATGSSWRHGWCVRHLQELPAQGAAVKLVLSVARWRCLNPDGTQRTFGDRLPQIVVPNGCRTRHVVDLARVLAHTTGGWPAGRLMTRLGVPQGRDTLLPFIEARGDRPAGRAARSYGRHGRLELAQGQQLRDDPGGSGAT